MRVLVTGGAGFIGSHYVRKVLGGAYDTMADAEVVGQYIVGSPAYLSQKDRAKLPGN